MHVTIKTSHCFPNSFMQYPDSWHKQEPAHLQDIKGPFFPPTSFSGYSSCLDTITGVLSGLKDYLVSSGSRVPKLSPVKLSRAEFQQIQQAPPACRICLEPLMTNIPTEMLSNTVVSPFPNSRRILLRYNSWEISQLPPLSIYTPLWANTFVDNPCKSQTLKTQSSSLTNSRVIQSSS